MQEINPRQIQQDSAGLNDVLTWNGTRWIPQDPPSGADGNGIYTGSGNIPGNTTATVSNTGSFRFAFNNGNDAIRINDNDNILLKSDTGVTTFNVAEFGFNLNVGTTGSFGLSVADGYFTLNDAPLVIDRVGSGIDPKAILDLNAVDKAFFPPRLTNSERTTLTGAGINDGAIIYNISSGKLNIRSGGSWKELQDSIDGNGIYSGSGTVPDNTVATLEAFGSFSFDYFGGINAIKIDGPEILLQSGSALRKVSIDNSVVSLVSNSSVLSLSGSDLFVNKNTLISTNGGSIDANAILDLSSNDKYLYLSRVTTANLSGTANNGAIVYDSTANVFKGRQGGAWVTFANAAPGNGGIYGGSGTVPAGVNATLTSTLAFRYPNTVEALKISNASGLNLQSVGPAGVNALNIDDTSVRITTNAGEHIAEWIKSTDVFSTSFKTLISDIGGTITAKAILDLKSTSKAFFPPRMTTTERDTVSTGGVDNGAILYNSTTHKFTVRQNGAWVEMGSGSGNVTATGGGTYRIAVFDSATNIQGDTTFVFDYDQNRLGVHQGTPLEPVHITGYTRVDNAILTRGSGDDLENTAAASIHIVNTAQTSRNWYVGVNGSAEFRIGNTDNQIVEISDGPQQFSLLGSFAYRNAKTIAAFGANQNNLALGDLDQASVVKVSATVAVNITGIVANAAMAGRQILLVNTGANNITLKHDDANSAAGNRFLNRGNGDAVLVQNSTAIIWRDNGDSRWRVVSFT